MTASGCEDLGLDGGLPWPDAAVPQPDASDTFDAGSPTTDASVDAAQEAGSLDATTDARADASVKADAGDVSDASLDASDASDLGDAAIEAPESGEPFEVVDTARLGTLIGYGKFMLEADAPANVRSSEAGGDVVWGTDEGFIAELNVDGEDRTYFFFGDTHTRTGGIFANPFGPASRGVNAGDIIAYTTDDTAEDGVQLDHVLRNGVSASGDDLPRACESVADDGYRSMYVPDVNHACTGNDDGVEVPTGVFALPSTDADPARFVIWWGEAGDLADTSGSHTYMAMSEDLGYTWSTLRSADGDPAVFSPRIEDTPSKFLVAQPWLVDAADFQSDSAAPCHAPLPSGDDTRGAFVFGSGRYRGSDIYLAFVSIPDLLAAFADPESASLDTAVHYFAGVTDGGCWSRDERDAVAVVRATDVGPFQAVEDDCGNRVAEGSAGAGEFSVTHVSEGRFDRLVLMLNNAYRLEDGRMGGFGAQIVTGDPQRPWLWNTPAPFESLRGDALQPARAYRPLFVGRPPGDDVDGVGSVCPSEWTPQTSLEGYGPMLLDRYTRAAAVEGGVVLTFTYSRWDASLDYQASPYRVDLFRTTLLPR